MIQLTPSKPGYKKTGVTDLDVCITLTPKQGKAKKTGRQPLNIALVIDRSSSMAQSAVKAEAPAYYPMASPFIGVPPGSPVLPNPPPAMHFPSQPPFYAQHEQSKMAFAINAILKALARMADQDRVSVVSFDNVVEVLQASETLGTHETQVRQAVQALTPRGMTALHDGWVEGGRQVAGHMRPGQMDRIILLTDGEANVGKTRPADICADVAGLRERGVSTTTLGVGLQFNESLLQGMAEAGDGNYYYVDDVNQLDGFFTDEFHALQTLVGRNARLRLLPGKGVTVTHKWNGLVEVDGWMALPSLRAGKELDVFVSLDVHGASVEDTLLRVELEWTSVSGKTKRSIVDWTLPSMTKAKWESAPEDSEVRGKKAVYEVHKNKQAALNALQNGDTAAANVFLSAATSVLSAAPQTRAVFSARADMDVIAASALSGVDGLRKTVAYQTYKTRDSR